MASLDATRQLIERYYYELWNEWRFDLADRFLSPSVKFHGSVGVSVEGVEGFLGYMRLIQAAFPDFHNTIEEMVAEGDRVAARLTYRGTHNGVIFGVKPTGRTIQYDGLALFRVSDAKVAEGYVLGNVIHLLAQLGIRIAAKES
ncbi:MAG TPA: ester cyclase [Bryobacteraceae bacterium]|nr:ester cyclase [Bryobacteraceae bacterium]